MGQGLYCVELASSPRVGSLHVLHVPSTIDSLIVGVCVNVNGCLSFSVALH